jgi:hypothetical protein
LKTNPTTFELDTVHYIWYDTKASQWQMTTKSPPGRHAINSSGTPTYMKADGSLQRYVSDPGTGYQTIDTMVDPHYEIGAHLQLYTVYPDPATSSRGEDVFDWQPSSGYGNLLGTLTFRNFCGGALSGNNNGGTYTTPD